MTDRRVLSSLSARFLDAPNLVDTPARPSLCDRILVMRRGELRALDATAFNREEILKAAL